MERVYRDITLKKRKQYVGAAVIMLMIFIMFQCMSGISEDLFVKMLRMGTSSMEPIIFQYDASDDEDKAPLFLWVLTPAILSYTWEEDEPDFQIMNIQKESMLPDTEVSNKKISVIVAPDGELALIQENLYMEDLLEMTQFDDPLYLQNELNIENSTVIPPVNYEKYADKSELIKDFYVIDASTSADTELLDIHKLTSYDCTLEKSADGPQILVYHSHSQEAFADSVTGDESTTIVGAGEKLSKLLEEVYGYDVLHHKGVYDVPSRDNAYSNALPDVERVLKENPSIQVVIDLHRDAVAEGRKLVTTIDGKDYARFMFFNGICRSTTGPISYLNNPYLEENLAFSFAAQRVSESYFPGITRKIYLKAWRYNMHLKPRNMLIELGAQTNTVEEIMNTTEILAFVIDKVLSGQ